MDEKCMGCFSLDITARARQHTRNHSYLNERNKLVMNTLKFFLKITQQPTLPNHNLTTINAEQGSRGAPNYTNCQAINKNTLK